MKSGSELELKPTSRIHVLACFVYGSVASFHSQTEGSARLLDQIRHQTVIIINSSQGQE